MSVLAIVAGALLLAAPFVALGIFLVRTEGWECFFFVYGLTAAITVLFVAAAMLIAWGATS